MKKIALLLVVVIGLGITTNAQDVIILKTGNEIKSLVNEVGPDYVMYKKWENQTGPSYYQRKDEVLIIMYENGTKDIFSEATTTTTESSSQTISENSNIMYIDNICVLNTNCGFQIMCYDLPNKMTWYESRKACPKGYHLPDYNEMRCMCMEHSPNYEITEKNRSYSVGTTGPLNPLNPYNRTIGGGSTTNTAYIHKNQYELALHITERIYWTRSIKDNDTPIAITTDDAKRESKDPYRKFYVRCVKDL